MQIISSYGVELRKQNIPIRQTLEIYRSAVSYLIGIYVQTWEELAEIPDVKRRFNAAERLVHTTKKNHADVIVFEYLEMQWKISGKKKQKQIGRAHV